MCAAISCKQLKLCIVSLIAIWQLSLILDETIILTVVHIHQKLNIFSLSLKFVLSVNIIKMGQKRKNRNGKDDFEYDPAPKHLHVVHIKNQEKRLIIILEKAQLESVKVRLYLSS